MSCEISMSAKKIAYVSNVLRKELFGHHVCSRHCSFRLYDLGKGTFATSSLSDDYFLSGLDNNSL